jgi:hypothetical protein
MERLCKECGFVKPLEEFHKHPTALDGRMRTCATCTNARAARRRAEIELFSIAKQLARWRRPVELSTLEQ